jgi:hypothetical protein
LEPRFPVDQQPHPALQILAARPGLFTQQGSVVAAWRRHGTKTYGPYYRLAYRDAGRQISIYLGRDDKPGHLVERVRQQLAALQAPSRQRRALDRLSRTIKSALRVQKTKLDAQLRPFGLRLKGFEVRGWRTSPLRSKLTATFPTPSFARMRRSLTSLRPKKCPSLASPAQRIEAFIAARRNR